MKLLIYLFFHRGPTSAHSPPTRCGSVGDIEECLADGETESGSCWR